MNIYAAICICSDGDGIFIFLRKGTWLHVLPASQPNPEHTMEHDRMNEKQARDAKETERELRKYKREFCVSGSCVALITISEHQKSQDIHSVRW